MANASLLVTWGNPIPGRENQALEIFMGIVQKYTGLQAEGKIERHSVHMATSGNTNDFAGAMIVEGEITQLRDLIAAAPAAPGDAVKAMEDEELEQLRALGYIE